MIHKKDIDESIEPNVGDHSLSTVPQQTALTRPFKGVDIEGLESIPMNMVAVPYVRLIQPTSQKTEDSRGKETMPGNFLFNDTQKAVGEINCVLLRAKHEMVEFEQTDGQLVTKPRVSVLGYDLDSDKIFVLSLSATSFSSFGKLIAKFKDLKVDKTYRFSLSLTSVKQENKKGKYWTVDFKIEKELKDKDLQEMEKAAQEYGVVLDRQTIADEE